MPFKNSLNASILKMSEKTEDFADFSGTWKGFQTHIVPQKGPFTSKVSSSWSKRRKWEGTTHSNWPWNVLRRSSLWGNQIQSFCSPGTRRDDHGQNWNSQGDLPHWAFVETHHRFDTANYDSLQVNTYIKDTFWYRKRTKDQKMDQKLTKRSNKPIIHQNKLKMDQKRLKRTIKMSPKIDSKRPQTG